MKATYIGYGNDQYWGVHDFSGLKKIVVRSQKERRFKTEVKNGALMITVPNYHSVELQVVGPGLAEIAGVFDHLALNLSQGVKLDASLATVEYQQVIATEADVFNKAVGKGCLNDHPLT